MKLSIVGRNTIMIADSCYIVIPVLFRFTGCFHRLGSFFQFVPLFFFFLSFLIQLISDSSDPRWVLKNDLENESDTRWCMYIVEDGWLYNETPDHVIYEAYRSQVDQLHRIMSLRFMEKLNIWSCIIVSFLNVWGLIIYFVT